MLKENVDFMDKVIVFEKLFVEMEVVKGDLVMESEIEE